MSSILLRTLSSHLEIGNHCPIRVNCNVGINSETGRSYEIERLEAIKNCEVQPDTFMDLSIGHYGKPFYKEIQERFDVPIGFVPSYLLPCDSAITKSEAFDIIKSLADEGVAFVTLHLTASTELYDLAKATRKIPVTSRGGDLVCGRHPFAARQCAHGMQILAVLLMFWSVAVIVFVTSWLVAWDLRFWWIPEEKIEVIYNWVDQNSVVDIPREENVLFERFGLDRTKFYVTYNGNIGLTQNMDMLLDVAKSLEANEDIQFVLVGNGAYLDQVKQIIKDRDIANVHLLPFQPYEEISHVFSLGDVSMVISKPGVGANSVPSKTWSIMSASRPVLANFDENELKSIIEDHNCGIFTKAGDKDAFTKAIIKLYNDQDLCREMGKNGRRFVMENLTKEAGTKKYVDVMKSFEK